MINFNNVINVKKKAKHNLNQPYVPDYSYKVLIIRDSESGKTNILINLINHQPDIDKVYLCTKDLYEAKY